MKCRECETPTNKRIYCEEHRHLYAESTKNERKSLALPPYRDVPMEWAAALVVKIAEEEGVPVLDVVGRSRKVKASRARHRAMYVMREEWRMPLKLIGRYLGRHHSTVIAGCRKVAKRMRATTDGA